MSCVLVVCLGKCVIDCCNLVVCLRKVAITVYLLESWSCNLKHSDDTTSFITVHQRSNNVINGLFNHPQKYVFESHKIEQNLKSITGVASHSKCNRCYKHFINWLSFCQHQLYFQNQIQAFYLVSETSFLLDVTSLNKSKRQKNTLKIPVIQ